MHVYLCLVLYCYVSYVCCLQMLSACTDSKSTSAVCGCQVLAGPSPSRSSLEGAGSLEQVRLGRCQNECQGGGPVGLVTFGFRCLWSLLPSITELLKLQHNYAMYNLVPPQHPFHGSIHEHQAPSHTTCSAKRQFVNWIILGSHRQSYSLQGCGTTWKSIGGIAGTSLSEAWQVANPCLAKGVPSKTQEVAYGAYNGDPYGPMQATVPTRSN